MKKVIIISSSDIWTKSCARSLKRLGYPDITIINSFSDLNFHINEEPLEARNRRITQSVLGQYEKLSLELEKLSFRELKDSIAIFDGGFIGTQIDSLQPLAYPPDTYQLAALLVLSFPEIYWIWFTLTENPVQDGHHWHWTNSLAEQFAGIRHTELLDPEGYRNNIKVRINKLLAKESEARIVIERDSKNIAVSIDEEFSYSFMHAYIAYRLGFLCYLIASQDQMNICKKVDAPLAEALFFRTSFEDVFLNFPDSDGNVHFSNLKQRDIDFYGRLAETTNRIFITCGHKKIRWAQENKDYLNKLRKSGKRIKIIYKPSGGIYNIIKKGGLLGDYFKKRKADWLATKPSNDITHSHSASGRLLIIGDRLIARAEKVFAEAISVQDCIQGAVLALEAVELLGYRTPTTSLEAVVLRHKLEVKAECMFYGVGYNIDVKNRIKELNGEISAISRWFHPSIKRSSALNAKMGIITEIMKIFSECGQFDEEQACLRYLRKLNRRWYFMNHPWLSFIRPIRAYIETLVGSLPLFIIALFSWPIAGGILSSLLHANFGKDVVNFTDHITNALITFFGLQPTAFPSGAPAHFIVLFLILGGFLHLGIFISYLYTLLTRK